MSRKTVERNVKRSYITGKAKLLIDRNGVESITMDNIGEAAGYTRQSLYRFFSSYDDLCLAVLIVNERERLALQIDAVGDAVTGIDRLTATIRFIYRHAIDNPNAFRLQVYWDFHGIDPDLVSSRNFDDFESVNTLHLIELQKIFQVGVEDRSIRADLPIDLCISQLSVGFRAVIQRATHGKYSFLDIDVDQYLENYLTLQLRAIRGNSNCEVLPIAAAQS